MKLTSEHAFARSRIFLGFAFLIVCLGLTACSVGGTGSGSLATSTPPRGAPAGGTVKVALLLPLTGNVNAQQVAKAMKQAGELALFDFDKPNVQLIPKDTRGTPDGARRAADEAIRDGAELIIGPLFANEVTAVAPVAQAARVPVLAFSSDRNVAGNGVYLLSFVAGSDVPRMVSYAAANGKKRFAALFPQNDYGRIVEQAFNRAVQANGGQVVLTKSFPPEANGMLASVKELAPLAKKGAAPQVDAIFVPAGGDTLPSLAPLFPYYEMDTQAVKMIGLSGWDYVGVGKEAALQGGWFPAPDPKGWEDFTRRYSETYGEMPPRLASLSYDAVSLAISLSNNPPERRFASSELMRASGFNGVDGLFRLRADGTAERGFAIMEVRSTGNQTIDPAPASFGTAVAQY
ncbi:penicillin-binding protein activator [Rhodomicrobium lacus]|uniref:penicillin-binding protein activator n=1 Tax=Rhodomicrobium lacus TaxID=2498452 RepID=UPI000F8D4E96|nr:penicillin-binding protein activator [Rhodomicrobium lacus]